ncbi:hypothetical protein CEXT_251821 [Caerostris extrusa]|uniref:Uncharacterized protein n=1 Tax=Caerostris extrusa TaxID=172846 RepID=A0AAV4XC55_CAEEX|nr:hypothetical protein CEXT_251821 [Caerostris extrusa]
MLLIHRAMPVGSLASGRSGRRRHQRRGTPRFSWLGVGVTIDPINKLSFQKSNEETNDFLSETTWKKDLGFEIGSWNVLCYIEADKC